MITANLELMFTGNVVKIALSVKLNLEEFRVIFGFEGTKCLLEMILIE